MKDIIAVVLAAGQGTRMGSEEKKLPKVMFEIAGQPMIRYNLDNLKNAGISDIVVVVGYEKEKVMDFIGDEVEYAEQFERLGTGHAVAMAKENVKGKAKWLLVCYGDMPLFQPATIKKLIEKVTNSPAGEPTIGMLTVNFDDPEFWAYGRIVRNASGNIEKIVEQKDCQPDELKIKECNPSFFIFDNDWFWENIVKLSTANAQKEYYLTDMIGLATDQGKKIIGLPVGEEWEALGINNPDQLKEAEEILKKIKK